MAQQQQLIQEALQQYSQEAFGKRNPFAASAEVICRINRIPVHSLVELPRQIRFSLVSLLGFEDATPPVAMTKRFLATGIDYGERPANHAAGTRGTSCASGRSLQTHSQLLNSAHYRELVAPSPDEELAMLARYSRALTKMSGKESSIACFNELAFPVNDQFPRPDAVSESSDFVEREQALLIAGSAHERPHLGNTARIFYPGSPQGGALCHKQTSAHMAEERISVPAARLSTVVQAFGLKIGVLLCSDIADYSAVSRIVQHGADIILVPCHSKSLGKLSYLARDISAAMKGIVALVNYYSRQPGIPSNCVYFSGVRQTPSRTRALVLQRKRLGEINEYAIPFDDLVIAQRALPNKEDARRNALEWLFQSKDEAELQYPMPVTDAHQGARP